MKNLTILVHSKPFFHSIQTYSTVSCHVTERYIKENNGNTDILTSKKTFLKYINITNNKKW